MEDKFDPKEKEVLTVDPKTQPKIQGSFIMDKSATLLPQNGHIEPENPHLSHGSATRQILAAFVAQLGTVNTGMAFGFSAIAISQLRDANSTMQIDDTQESWIASMSSIGTPIGCLLSGYLMDQLGRKRSLIITEIPALLGWLLITFASNIEMIYAGRFFTGLGSGMVGAPARVYTSEVTQPHLRGMLTALSSVGVSTGVMLEYAMGGVTSWKICAAISSLIPASALILMFIFPETPSYLISRNKPEKARKALEHFRGSSYNLNKEMDTLINFSNKNNLKRLTTPKEILHAILQPNALKPFALLFFYFLIYQWSGTNAVTFYAVDIFQKSGTTINKYLATTILGVVRFFSTILACILCRKCGRRPLTMVSSIGCGLTMIGLGTYMWVNNYWKVNNIPATFTWVPVVCIFAYTIACTIGFLVIPWIMIGEVYPVQVRGIIGGFTTMSAHCFVFMVVKTFPFLRASITEHGTFLLYGFISLFGTIYFYICLPETKNKSLQEIEDYFSGRNSTLKTGRLFKKKQEKNLRIQKGEILPR
ncbi:facilitated trehalose transporter Tret1-like isoform X2 [Microplitis mediator]|uniref:facilitated trehalose transporter Tret1-like isoform X2 n=1 Tax=Microplitis mediator TaxID=375433 RepID=UPI002556B1C4|nr:facilitated trehalose transporter Tret1-like isoform X2 [Microplitis mediator]